MYVCVSTNKYTKHQKDHEEPKRENDLPLPMTTIYCLHPRPLLIFSLLPPSPPPTRSHPHSDDVSQATTDSFRLKVLGAKEGGTSAPIRSIDSSTFVYCRHLNMYFVAVTRSNVNPSLVLEFLYQKIRVLQAYLGETFTEDKVR